MAERRMFTKKIIDGDEFTSMPPTAQCLYFHLCMSADDDGFSNQMRSCLFHAHASTDDVDTLVKKRFIIPFESGVIVIKHWRMHNIIKSDRYHHTEYLEEMARLSLKDNQVYTDRDLTVAGTIVEPSRNQTGTNLEPEWNQVGTKLEPEWNQSGTRMEPNWNPNGTILEPEVRLGKDSIYSSSNEELRPTSSKRDPAKSAHQDIVEAWNELKAYGIAPIRAIPNGSNRASMVSGRINQYGKDAIFEAIEMVKDSDFLLGRTKKTGEHRNWRMTFDWFIAPSNFPKVLEGQYSNTTPATSAPDADLHNGRVYE